jgi:hypothetical protein
MWELERRAQANLWTKHRNRTQTTSKPELPACSGSSMEGTYLLAMRCPVHRRRDSNSGFCTELENLGGDAKGKGASGCPMRPKVPRHWPGRHCFVVARKRGNSRGVKGAGHPRQNGVNGKPEELLGSGGRRRPSLGWHEPDESRGSRPDLWEARGAIPRAYPATGNRTKSNRTAAARESLANCHREAKVPAPLLDSTQNPARAGGGQLQIGGGGAGPKGGGCSRIFPPM